MRSRSASCTQLIAFGASRTRLIAYKSIAKFAVALKFEGEKRIMSNTINNSRDLLPSNAQEVKLGSTEKELQRNPILKIWRAIATFFKKEQVNIIESRQDSQPTVNHVDLGREQHYYTRFTDRVDPSLYYTIFVSRKL